MVHIVPAHPKESIAEVRKIFLEYAKSLDFKLCFQEFDKELERLPGEYSPPDGRLHLAVDGKKIVGCVALHRFDDGICEMKRLYVRPERRREGIGRALAELVIEEAKEIGYSKMRLDTVATMKEAISLYTSLGFLEIAPYRPNPLEGAKYFELILK